MVRLIAPIVCFVVGVIYLLLSLSIYRFLELVIRKVQNIFQFLSRVY